MHTFCIEDENAFLKSALSGILKWQIKYWKKQTNKKISIKHLLLSKKHNEHVSEDADASFATNDEGMLLLLFYILIQKSIWIIYLFPSSNLFLILWKKV